MNFPRTEATLKRLGDKIVEELKGYVPVDSGDLKNSIKFTYKVNRDGYILNLKYSKYGYYLHTGTKGPRKPPPIDALKSWADRKGINPYALQKSIAKNGTKAQPWLFHEDIIKDYKGALTRAMKQDVIDFLKK